MVERDVEMNPPGRLPGQGVEGLRQVIGSQDPVLTLFPHLDIETYTWSVLPSGQVGIVDGIAAEIGWAESHLLAAAPAS